MLLSIVVLSYNRPKQIERILKNLIGVKCSGFNLVIKDDLSPRRIEIEEVVRRYSEVLNFDVRFHCNVENMGYDKNLIDSFDIVESDYVFLLSDDDYIKGDGLPLLISVLEKRESVFYFTPYTDGQLSKRVIGESYDFSRFSDVIYNSILFSGLVFKRDAVRSLDINYDFLSDCIYSQVFLASLLVYQSECYGVLPENVLSLGGDGENFFGKNESAKNADLLVDRKRITADLDYQRFLLRVVDEIALFTEPYVKTMFYHEYRKRLISYGFKARSLGLPTYLSFLKHYFKSKEQFMFFPSLFFLTNIILPSLISKKIYSLGVKFLRKSG